MCGLLGIIGSGEELLNKIDLLKHRGPEHTKVWESRYNQRFISLGQTRLCVLDLTETGNQPLISEDQRFVFIFNGEIYNYLELKKQLKSRGINFKGESDTEVFFRGLIHEGIDFQKKCNGMWAFVLWDNLKKTALFGRDRFGKKPLYFCSLQKGVGIVVASEMKALLPYLREIEPNENLPYFLINQFDYEHTSECIFKDIKRLPAGHYAEFKNNNLQIVKWWNTLDNLVNVPTKYNKQVEEWREIFLDSVRIRMRSDVPIGIALSGGLDSSAILSTMSYLASKENETFYDLNWKNAFNSHFPGSSLDESRWAVELCKSLGVDINLIEIDSSKTKWNLKTALRQVEDPYLTLPIPMLMVYEAISAAGIKVTLDGHGADELFSGYGHLSKTYKSARNPMELAELIATVKSGETGEYAPDLKNKNFVWLKQNVINGLENLPKLSVRPILWTLGIIPKENIFYNLEYEEQSSNTFKQLDELNKSLYELFHVSVLPTLLRNYDRYSMANSVEVRMPFMDWRLVTYTFSLPWTSKIGNGFSKRIMRDALDGIVPNSHRLRRDKIGWNAPLHEWLREELGGEINKILIENKAPKKLLKKWARFKKIKSIDFADGVKMWNLLLPFLLEKIVFNSVRQKIIKSKSN